MNRAFPVLVTVLLILCSPAAVFGVGASSPTTTTPSAKNPTHPSGFNNTSAHLSLGTAGRSDTATPSLSLSTALEMDRNTLKTEKRMYTLDEQLSKVSTSGEKRQILLRFRGKLERKLSSLQTHERTASQQFNGQEIDTDEYVKELAILQTEADDLERSMKYMTSEGENVVKFSPHEREFQSDLIPLRSRVRESAVSSIRYGTSSKPLYVATSQSGVVLATVINDQYIREAYRDDYRNRSVNGFLSVQKARNVTVSQYPWASANGDPPSTYQVYDKVTKTRIVHPQGLIRAYLDSGTKKIYREIQYKVLAGDDHVPYGTTFQNNSTNLHLVVNRTYSGGPLRINLTDSEGDPVDGHIEIGETELGDTGPTGTIYTVSPSREFTVTATHDSETVKVTLTPYGVTNGSSNGETPRNAGGSA